MIPEGYRLLTAEDVGKVFGVDLEFIIYFDNEITPNFPNASEYSLETASFSLIRSTMTSLMYYDYNYDANDIYKYSSWRESSIDVSYCVPDMYIAEPIIVSDWFATNNNWLYVKDIVIEEDEEEEETTTSPYLIKIKNKNGIILKTANKLCTENITLVLDESLFEPTGPTGPVLTLICDSSVLNSSNYTYSLDGGSTWNQFTSENMILENPTQIRFKGTGSAHIGHQLYVGASLGASDIARVSGTASNDFTITEDTTWYVRGYYSNGGND